MSKRFFTSDFHLNSPILLDKSIVGDEVRPFKSVEKLNAAILRSCNQKAKTYSHQEPVLNNDGSQATDASGNLLFKTVIDDRDTIIHLGDFCCTVKARGQIGGDINPQKIIEDQINANFINVRGNHDASNGVKWVCESMQLHLGKRYPNVTACHYPSYDTRASEYVKSGYIHLCGHVHGSWKHCLDLDRQILNINVGVDVWKYRIVSEDEVIKYIDSLLRKKPSDMFRCKVVKSESGRDTLMFMGEASKA